MTTTEKSGGSSSSCRRFCTRAFVVFVFAAVANNLFFGIGSPHLNHDAYRFGFKDQAVIAVTNAGTEAKARDEEAPRRPNNNNNNNNNNTLLLQRYRHDFTYDRERWKDPPRIVILAGPHKTASTTLQSFFAAIAGSDVSVKSDDGRDDREKQGGHTPHPGVTDWVWPIGIKNEHVEPRSPGGGFVRLQKPGKFYAPLACAITNRHMMDFFPETRKGKTSKREARNKAKRYYRSLLRRPWDKGKRIVFGSEEFDGFVRDLTADSSVPSDSGEETHVSGTSGAMVDDLLSILPWANDEAANATAAANSTTSSSSALAVADDGHPMVPPLRLEDIEVQINYRTPRIAHMASIWHQRGHFVTFRNFLIHRSMNEFYQLNSLAVALQFVRKGIKTTIVNMAGVYQRSTAVVGGGGERVSNETVVGGLQGTIACEILRMGNDMTTTTTTTSLCDDRNRIHLSGYEKPVQNYNNKTDNNSRNLDSDQIGAINRLVEDYDCGVRQHLKRYQDRGLLRILGPTEDLFETCSPPPVDTDGSSNSSSSNRDVSFRETMQAVAEVASRDNGIPVQTREEEAEYAKIQKEENQRLKRENRERARASNNEGDVDGDVDEDDDSPDR